MNHEKVAWVLIRFMGVVLLFKVALGLMASLAAFSSLIPLLASMGDEGAELRDPLFKSLVPGIMTILFSILPSLVIGWYCLKRGNSLHRVICRIPLVASSEAIPEESSLPSPDEFAPATIPPVTQVQPTNEEVIQLRQQHIRAERAQRDTSVDRATQQRALFAQFAQAHPVEASLPPKARYEAFRIWQENQ